MEMAIMSIVCRKEPEDEERMRKGMKKKVDLFVFLPDDIVVDIFRRLPEAFLGYKGKYVCRRWMDLISNRILLDRASFILQKTGGTFTARHVDIREEGEEVLQANVRYLKIPLLGMIRSWGNEFLLIKSDDNGKKRCLYVYNLITKEGSYLPKCNASCGGHCTIRCGVAISVDVFKGIYKVVHLYPGPPIECHILILSKDINVSSKWKKIQLPNYCMNDKWMFYCGPVSVQGRYVHWGVISEVRSDKRLVSIDMVKEEVVDRSLSSLPLADDGSRVIIFQSTIFEMGGSLALFAGVSKDKVEIWILKDFQNNNWEKLQSVTLENWYHKSFPVCGVTSRSNKYIIVESDFVDGMWYYDLKNGAMEKLDIHIGDDNRCMVHSSPPSF